MMTFRCTSLTRVFLYLLILLLSSIYKPAHAAPKQTFQVGTDSFLLNGKPFVIRCGEIHFARVPREYWRHRLRMCKAMGLNAVCAYLFWNFHEWQPGKFEWTGERDAAEFCRIVQEEGLWVLLRPGPYACAEWEMGGLPWWLLKKDGRFLRTRDADYINASRKWLQEMGRVLAPLQVSRGGPILMVQVENEYGYFGNDLKYMEELETIMREAGFEVPLFACNPGFKLKDPSPPGLLKVVNFGSNAAWAANALREAQPNKPLMCGEFYPGWFDLWGDPHSTGNLPGYLKDLEYMLQNKMSFSIYMAHGGTSFGLWAGSTGPKPGNLAFRPDTTSYDYDAPISEAGWGGAKFQATRELLSKYLNPGETVPELPAANPVMEFPAVELRETAPLFDNLPKAVEDTEPRPMEQYDQGRGCILYRTTLPAGPAGKLTVQAVGDFGWVYLNGQQLGRLDRRYRAYSVQVPKRESPMMLDVLVEAMGRINFAQEMHDRKGLHGPVNFKTVAGEQKLTGWKVFNLDLEDASLRTLKWHRAPINKMPAFWRGEFEVVRPDDTFLDVSSWGKGVVWINGRCLGRFWNIGPTQTMYLPGPWLKTGRNQVTVLDLIGPEKPVLSGQKQPVLAKLRSELDFRIVSKVSAGKLQLETGELLQSGTLADTDQPQSVRFTKSGTGRQVAFQMLNEQEGRHFAVIAEFDLLDEAGQIIPRDKWTVAYIDSEELSAENGSVSGAIDGVTGQREEIWHSEWSRRQTPYPHCLVIDLGVPTRVAGLRYTPRKNPKGGRVKDFRFYIGEKLVIPPPDEG